MAGRETSGKRRTSIGALKTRKIKTRKTNLARLQRANHNAHVPDVSRPVIFTPRLQRENRLCTAQFVLII